MKNIKILQDLCNLDAIAGYEDEVRHYMKTHMKAMNYEIIQDKLGSIFAYKPSKKENAPTIMIAGHMDEVGFIVTGYTKHGLLKIHPLGGFWSQVLLTMRVTVTNSKKEKYHGVVSTIAPHLLTPELRNVPYDIKNMEIDCGFIDEDDARQHVEIGAMVTPEKNFKKLSDNRYISKAFDNRYGCAMALDILCEIKNLELDVNLYIGATVQEETGLRGATTSANMIKPDIFIAVDASPARDTAGAVDELGRLGNGFLVRHFDRTYIHNRNFKNYILNLSDQNSVAYQDYFSPGGTDAGAVHISNNGVISTIFGIPARNIHTSSSIMDMRDYDSAKEIIMLVLNDLNKEKLKEIVHG
ncbi:MAG: M42 family metallopeptidase [Bacilli bacterium]